MKVKVKKLPHFYGLELPFYATSYAVGMDLLAAIEEDITVKPMQRVVVPTGICVEIPDGYELQVRPRSGLALKHGVTVLNSPGTIDPDYRGEIKVILINLGEKDFTIKRGDRIAQMVLCPIVRFEWEEVQELSPTLRGESGFGSTGL